MRIQTRFRGSALPPGPSQPANRASSPSGVPGPGSNVPNLPPDPPSQDELDEVDFLALTGTGKAPGAFSKFLRWTANTASYVGLALTLAPVVGHLVVAREVSKIHRYFNPDEPERSPADWLRVHWPGDFSEKMGGLMEAGSRPIQNQLGLKLDDLADVQRHFLQTMAPVTNADGVRQMPDFIQELAAVPFRPPGTPYPAFVFLDESREDVAKEVRDLWNSPRRPPSNPYDKSDQRHPIWSVLQEMHEEGKLPIFLDLDGDNQTFTPTEFVAKRTLASMAERNNSFGDSFTDPGLYFAWLTTRLESSQRQLTPWLREQSTELVRDIDSLKTKLIAPWLGGETGMGPFPSTKNVDAAFEEFLRVRDEAGGDSRSVAAWNRMADAVTLLDRDVVTGVQTHWIKLLREIGGDRRDQALPQVWEGFVALNLVPPDDADFGTISPPQAPVLQELEGEPARIVRRPYDRALSLGEVVDHTLDGLGLSERRAAVSAIKQHVAEALPQIEAREARLRLALGDDYHGLDLAAIVLGDHNLAESRQALRQLKAARDNEAISREQSLEAARHWSLLDWLVNSDSRYGEIDFGLVEGANRFREHPLAVSEYYEPQEGNFVSVLNRPTQLGELYGQDDGGGELKITQVFEGGGGKGFAALECLRQLHQGLDRASGQFRVDEFCGTSAGAQLALFRAAGVEVDDLNQVLTRLDFKEFNSDAAWLMGGVDPKVRGIDRTGVFSMQRMYKEIYQILSEKLGISGRPILFSDIPQKLNIAATVLNTNLPEDDPIRDLIEEDGLLVMSQETTPHFDVVGAVLGSSAVPAYFQSPQMEIAREVQLADGGTEIRRYHMQFADGGLINNMSFSSAGKAEENRALAILPAHYQTVHPETGEVIGLDVLNFDNKNLRYIDAHNRQLYGQFADKLGTMLGKAENEGVGRAVVAFDLSRPKELPVPVLQGNRPSQTDRLYELAEEVGMEVLDRGEAESKIRGKLHPNSPARMAMGTLFNLYFDDPDPKGDSLLRKNDGTYLKLGEREEQNIFEVARAAGAAAIASSEPEYARRRFEAPEG